MTLPPLTLHPEITLCEAPLRVFQARFGSSGLQVLVYELLGAPLSAGEVAQLREREPDLHVVANRASDPWVAVAGDGVVPLCAFPKPLPVGEFLPLAEQLCELLAAAHEETGFYRHLNDTTILIAPDHTVTLLSPGAASFLAERMLSAAEAGHSRAHLWTLRFTAPEQTGRMNLTPDTRADLYALGVAFYQLLTGRLPFESEDALELVHSHLARPPLPPREVNAAIPAVLEDIVMKLLAKTPEERYQGTFGLLEDLRECGKRQETGQMEPFPLGRNDVPERLTLPSRLYGRDAELHLLHETFDLTRNEERSALLLIGGFSGVGKTVLAQALKPVALQFGGCFLSGKIDQFRRNLPYASISEAFRGLVRQWQTESDARIAELRAELRRALGENGQVLADVIPEIELIIGPQPPVATLPANEALHRFNTVFQSFIRVVARPGQPLVLFLDDLQWMDAASLKLMEVLVSGVPNLLIIGAYRDNEVHRSHPLNATIERLERELGALVRRLALTSLPEPAVLQLLSDTLHAPEDLVAPLGRLLLGKTDGNAFFLSQFLQELYADGLLTFDRTAGRWTWDAARIQQSDISGDVVELMVAKIRKLSPAARAALPVAACLGNRFDVETLALVRGQDRESILNDLADAVDSGLLVPVAETPPLSQDSWRFLHDRVQQAAYSLLSDAEKSFIHAQAGRLLAEQARAAGNGAFEERIFEIANHLNRGWSEADRTSAIDLARINLQAMRRAHSALAYDGAAKYAIAGLRVLPLDAWEAYHDLTFELQLGLCECEILQGQFDSAEELAHTLLDKARDRFEKARVYLLRLTAYTTQTRMAEAAETGVAALAEFGMHLPVHPGKGAIVKEVLQARRNLGLRRPAELLNAPSMTDPDAIAAVEIMSATLAAAFQSDVLLWTLLTLKTVSLSLRFGNCAASAHAFANYAIVLCAPLGMYRAGLEFSELATKLSERPEYNSLRSQTYFTAGAFVNFWHHPLPAAIGLLQRSYECGPQSGEFVFASYSALHMVFQRLFKGEPLSSVERLTEEYLDFVHRVQYKEGPEYLRFFRQFIACLQGRTASQGSFADENYDELSHVREIGVYVNRLPLMYYSVLKMEALYVLDEPQQARRVAARYSRDKANIEQLSSMLFAPAFHFYNAMVSARLYPKALTREKRRIRLALEMEVRRFHKWARNCPANFTHLEALLRAELARIQENWHEAASAYEEAIASAEKYGFMQHGALAHERAATMHLQRRTRTRAAYHLNAARDGYAAWGATAKVRLMDEQYGVLIGASPQPKAAPGSGDHDSRIATDGAVSATLDLGTVVKASQAISGELEWARLLRVLMNIAIENAGAQRGLLLIENAGELRLAAQGGSGTVEVQPLEGAPLEEKGAPAFPLSVVNYVARTRESVVVANATSDELFATDPYILHGEGRSILCTPIVNQGRLVGVLYLENNLAEGAFTEERLRVLKLLAAQAAVSLEAARAFAQVRKSENQMQAILDNATTIIFMKDLEGRYLMVNEQFARITGNDKEQIIGATDYDLLPAGDAARMQAGDEQVKTALKPFEWEENVHVKNGERTYITVKFPLLDAEGKLYAVGGVATDITERKRAEQVLADYSHELEGEVAQRTQELRDNNRRLQDTLKQLQDTQQRMVLQENLAYLGTLTAGVAHEIQNPLNFVINFAQISSMLVEDLRDQLVTLRENPDDSAEEMLQETIADLDQNARKINEHGERINSIVKSMLLHSRGISPSHAPAHLNELLNDAIDLVYHGLRPENPDLKIHFEKHFDPFLDEHEVRVVAQDLSRVFANIISNAVYAVRKKQESNPEGFMPEIVVTSKVEEELVEIRVRDNGGGIAPTARGELFKPFFTTKPTGEGTGLGLSICYDIIAQQHGGELRVESLTDAEAGGDGNQGFAEFIICLPKII